MKTLVSIPSTGLAAALSIAGRERSDVFQDAKTFRRRPNVVGAHGTERLESSSDERMVARLAQSQDLWTLHATRELGISQCVFVCHAASGLLLSAEATKTFGIA